MTKLTITDNVIEDLRRRRSDGESLATLAAEVGVSWQRLWGVLAGTSPPPGQARPEAQPTPQMRREIAQVEREMHAVL